jgi:hypothetical protein
MLVSGENRRYTIERGSMLETGNNLNNVVSREHCITKVTRKQ